MHRGVASAAPARIKTCQGARVPGCHGAVVPKRPNGPTWPDVARCGPNARVAETAHKRSTATQDAADASLEAWRKVALSEHSDGAKPTLTTGGDMVSLPRLLPGCYCRANNAPQRRQHRASAPPDLPGYCCRATNALHQRQHRASAPPDLPGCCCRATNALHQRQHRAPAPPDLPGCCCRSPRAAAPPTPRLSVA